MAPLHVMRGCRGFILRKDQGREDDQDHLPTFVCEQKDALFLMDLAWRFPLIAVAKIRIFVKGRDGEMGVTSKFSLKILGRREFSMKK